MDTQQNSTQWQMPGIHRIALERIRQVQEEGWTPEHDDGHAQAEMAYAAVVYANVAANQIQGGPAATAPSMWPWDASWYKPSSDPIRNLVKAGALIAAEIDRIQRAIPSPQGESAASDKERVLARWPDAKITLYPDGAVAVFSQAALNSSGITGHIGWGQTSATKMVNAAVDDAWADAASKLEPAPIANEAGPRAPLTERIKSTMNGALLALRRSYNVTDYPADGTTIQDIAARELEGILREMGAEPAAGDGGDADDPELKEFEIARAHGDAKRCEALRANLNARLRRTVTNRMAHEEAAGYGLCDEFFRLSGIDPDAPYRPVAQPSPQESALPPRPKLSEFAEPFVLMKFVRAMNAYIDSLISHHAAELERVKGERDRAVGFLREAVEDGNRIIDEDGCSQKMLSRDINAFLEGVRGKNAG